MLCRADLANLVNEAALLAGRQNKDVVEKIDFIHAVERSIAVTSLFFCVAACLHIFKFVHEKYFEKCTCNYAYGCFCLCDTDFCGIHTLLHLSLFILISLCVV